MANVKPQLKVGKPDYREMELKERAKLWKALTALVFVATEGINELLEEARRD